MNDEELRDAFVEFRATGDRRLRNRLIEEHRWIAVTSAQKFRDRGEPLDDLVQVGLLGLVKAVERFDPTNGTPFAGFAIPTVTGELRRHFRDATWSVHVPRRMKEVSALITPANERLRERLGRHPTVIEIADELRVSVEDVLAGMEAAAAYRTSSISNDRADGSVRSIEPGDEDVELARSEARLAVERLLTTLPARERKILELRFFQDMSQSEIAAEVGTSQVHVSRLIRASLTALRQHIDHEPAMADGPQGDRRQ